MLRWIVNTTKQDFFRRLGRAGKSYRQTIILMLSLAVNGCLNDADRQNPLDPQSPVFDNVGTVTGRTLTFYAPFTPLPEVEVRMAPAGLLTRSQSSGNFRFERVPAGSYEILATKDGFVTARDSVVVQAGQLASVELNLDGLPAFASARLTSNHTSRWFPLDDLFALQVEARLSDPDGLSDIVLVELDIPELDFVDTLNVTETFGIFERTIVEARLPSRNLQNVLGHAVFLRATDRAGYQNTSEPIFLARVIETTPQTSAPQSFELLDSPRPTLVWQPATVDFNFTYDIQLFRVDFGLNTFVWGEQNIPDTTESIAVSMDLPDGTYFWTVSIVDEFGNASRSKEASFRIEQNLIAGNRQSVIYERNWHKN